MDRNLNPTISRIGLRSLVLLGIFCSAGCGDGGVDVTGKVTHNGKQVVWGNVIMVDSKGEYHQGKIGLDGTYRVSNVPAGPVRIGVTSPPPEGQSSRGSRDKGARKVDPNDPREKLKATPEQPLPPAGGWFQLPPKAGDPSTSGLTGNVQSGKPIDIDVK